MKFKSKSQTPLTSVKNSWSSSSVCKHFFPCNGLDANGHITDVKGNVVIKPQTGKSFLYNSLEQSIIPNCDGTNSNPTVYLYSGSWTTLGSTESMLFMCAGYVDSTYTANKTIRCSIGDVNGELSADSAVNPGFVSLTGFAMSDGIVSLYQHCLFNGDYQDLNGGNGNGCQNTAGGAAATGVTLSDGTYFIRYVLYQPGVQIESKILLQSGSVSMNSSTLYGDGLHLDQQGAHFVNAFRMHGFRCTGIAIYKFPTSTAPSDYMTAVNYNGALWKTGVREIYPKPGW